jgi:N-acetylglucosamine kinase-like BadF-type ATPase
LEYILGVDGGGTKTLINIADTSGKILSEAESGTVNYKIIGIKKAESNLNRGITDAIKNIFSNSDIIFKSACFGFTGLDHKDEYHIFEKIVLNRKIKKYFNPEKLIILNDSKLALELGGDLKNKIVIICGTGINCFGFDENGEKAEVNGWDYIMGDEGSGYFIGSRVLNAITKAFDGRGEKTILLERIIEIFKVRDIYELSRSLYEMPFSKGKIASIAETVCETAKMGDMVSIRILKEAAREVYISIRTVVKKLCLENKAFELILVGGLWKCEKNFGKLVKDQCLANFKKIRIILPELKPVIGAIKIAIKNI